MANKKQTLATILIVFAVVATLGYLTFREYKIAFVPNLASYNLVILAVAAGIAAFFSPCNFTLLPSYFSYYYSKSENSNAGHRTTALLSEGSVAALGVIGGDIVFGLLIGALGAGFGASFGVAAKVPNVVNVTFVRIFRGGIGLVLMILGILQLSNKNFHNRFIDGTVSKVLGGKTKNTRGPFLYGLTYTLAGIGCGFPILAGLSVFAFSVGSFLSALSAFLVFSLTMGALMIFVSLLVGLSKNTFITRIKELTPKIKKASGAILVAVGIMLLLSVIFLGAYVKLFWPTLAQSK